MMPTTIKLSAYATKFGHKRTSAAVSVRSLATFSSGSTKVSASSVKAKAKTPSVNASKRLLFSA
jgi:hypothetical protein